MVTRTESTTSLFGLLVECPERISRGASRPQNPPSSTISQFSIQGDKNTINCHYQGAQRLWQSLTVQ